MDKIKAFFQSTITKVVAWVVLALDIVVLVLGGTTAVEISDSVTLVVAIIAAIAALVAFIAERLKKNK